MSLPKFMCHGQSRTPVPTICKHPYEKKPKASAVCIEIIPCGQLSLRVLAIPFDIVNIVSIAL